MVLVICLLVPATGADQDATGGSQHRYDDELRPGHADRARAGALMTATLPELGPG